MKNNFNHFFSKLKENLPLLIIILVALTVAVTNINFGKHYAGWDNILAEFDLARYARQVFFGAWLEHQSLGAPAAQGQLSEIPRLPILLILKILLPDNLIRYVFIFAHYLIGGLGMYYYLIKKWIVDDHPSHKKYLAGVGGILYLLHILTLQQFHISFEMFMVQFAWLPFVLITIHQLQSRISSKSLLWFLLIQLLIAPSGHTSTVFYLAGVFSVFYAYSLKINQGFVRASKFAIFVGLLTFFANAYWIVPNLYYSVHDAKYVQESRENLIFGPESVYSIREATQVQNITQGTHYLFTWKDYNFYTQQFEYIFETWLPFINLPPIAIILHSIGIATILGLFTTLLSLKLGNKRFSIALIYLASMLLIWIDLFPTNFIVEKLYQNGSFLEAFRNPFTKPSIIYSFVSILLFINFIELFWQRINKIAFLTANKIFNLYTFSLILITLIIISAWPSFNGQFISDKLQVKFPSEYQQMADFLKQKDENLRILQLPQLSHAGWEYYDWQFLGQGNGYQGMGFYFFLFPQAQLNRDSDRWVETSDFFYHQLKYALDSQNVNLFKNILSQYQIDLIVIDESKIEPNIDHDITSDKNLLAQAGLDQIWQQNFLTIYQYHNPNQDQEIILPDSLTAVTANTNRVRKDVAYQNVDDYFFSDSPSVLFPFTNLYQTQINDLIVQDTQSSISQVVDRKNYQISIPGIQTDTYQTPVSIDFQNNLIKLTFPELSILLDDQEIKLPKIENQALQLDKPENNIILFFNDTGVIITNNEIANPVLSLIVDQPISISYSPIPDSFNPQQDQIIAQDLDLKLLSTIEPNWMEFKKEIVENKKVSKITLISKFYQPQLNLNQNPSLNCSSPEKGAIESTKINSGLIYAANEYGVNCNGYNFDYESPAYSYLLSIKGKGYQGRGTKLFVNYSDPQVLFEDFLLPSTEIFNQVVSLPQISTNPQSKFHFNWETRSFGRLSINQIDQMKLIPFPVDLFSQIKLTPEGTTPSHSNKIEVISEQKIYDSIFLISYKCENDPCFIGIDQSFDNLWIGFSPTTLKTFTHLRLNNWANLWQVSGQGEMMIVYLPELVSLTLLIILLSILVVLLIRNKFEKQSGPRLKFIHHHLLGDFQKKVM